MQQNNKQKITEYTKAIDQLIAARGTWQEAINLYVKAWK